jgi:hypothetical protein
MMRGRLGLVVNEVAGREPVFDQAVGGCRIRHAQEGFREHHQGQPLLGRERVFAEKVLDPAQSSRRGADRLHEPARPGVDAPLGGRVPFRPGEKGDRDRLVRGRERRGERLDRHRPGRRLSYRLHGHAGLRIGCNLRGLLAQI